MPVVLRVRLMRWARDEPVCRTRGALTDERRQVPGASHEWLDGAVDVVPARLGYGAGTPPTPRDVRRPPVRARGRFRHGRNGTPAPDGWPADGWQTGRLEGAAVTGNAARCSYQQATEGSVRRAGVAARDRSTNRPEARGHWARTLSPVCAISSGSSHGRGPRLGSRGNGGPALRYRFSVSFVTPPTGCSQRIAARRRAAWDLRAGDGGLLLGFERNPVQRECIGTRPTGAVAARQTSTERWHYPSQCRESKKKRAQSTELSG